MDNEIIRAYLWQEVIRLGFSPASDKDKKSWLVQYGKSLKDFWGIEEYPETPKIKGVSIGCNLSSSTQLDLLLEYQISSPSNFSILFLSEYRNLMWTHDVDQQNYFLFPEKSLLNKYGKFREAKRNFTHEHIGKVLDGLIFHPAVHQHIQSPIDNHDIRIGGGIYNPFVFLFHLRYQLCPDEGKRNDEKQRLITLFEEAIRNNRSVTISNLLK